jgi:hypothetical protein
MMLKVVLQMAGLFALSFAVTAIVLIATAAWLYEPERDAPRVAAR